METALESTETIYGPEIFFNFIEVPADKLGESGHLVKKLRTGEIHGVVVRNVIPEDEVARILKAIEKPVAESGMETPSGKTYPAPFAIVSNSDERLDTYYNMLKQFYALAEREPVIKGMLEKLDKFFKSIATDYKVSIPTNKIKNAHVSPGQFRVFNQGKGGLFVHCGNLFQTQTLHYYSLLANNIDMNDQLSFFWLMQNSEEGGELTIYDMLWKDVKRKKSAEENDSVIDDDDKTIMLKDLKSFSVKPMPGDILVFSGGPIWHRVENIKGETPRITFGGFLNYSKDDKELFYWA